MPDVEYEIQANGKSYTTVEEAIADYINELNPGVSTKKLKRITQAINLDIFYNLTHGLTWWKSPVTPLAYSTIADKGHAVPFLDTGKLWSSVNDEILNEHHGIIFIGDERADIASKLNYGEGPVPPREFFGLSKEVLNEIDAILEEDD